jgi:hypothetical protein
MPLYMMFVYTILVVRNREDFYRARLAWHEKEDSVKNIVSLYLCVVLI